MDIGLCAVYHIHLGTSTKIGFRNPDNLIPHTYHNWRHLHGILGDYVIHISLGMIHQLHTQNIETVAILVDQRSACTIATL